jgi:hypothetical protein
MHDVLACPPKRLGITCGKGWTVGTAQERLCPPYKDPLRSLRDVIRNSNSPN